MNKEQAKIFKTLISPQERQEFTCRLYITTMHNLVGRRGWGGLKNWEIHMLYTCYESVDFPDNQRIKPSKWGDPFSDKIVNILIDN